jgi:ABC-2 type transport system ATP-binding protein
MVMANAIDTVDLTRRYRQLEAVDGLNLHVPAGSVFALIGPNGAGKTTTIKLLMNLVHPTRGSATVLGMRARELTPHGFERIGYVSENQRLPQHLTPAGLLAYCRPFYKTWDAELARTLERDLRLPMDSPLRTLSRGTKMKAALLAALAYRPELVVLDEPFTGLDPLVRDELVHALLGLVASHPTTVFLSSHDIEEVERLADWIGFLDRGRFMFAEEVSSLLNRFRYVEVIGTSAAPLPVTSEPGWMAQGAAGRTRHFVDSTHHAPDAEQRITAAFPGAEIRIRPMSLRDIFVVLARQAQPSSHASEAA